MPSKFIGSEKPKTKLKKTTPREWTKEEEKWVLEMNKKGHSFREIAEATNRSETSVNIKIKRLKKENGEYNEEHIMEKYALNKMFLEEIKPKTVLDLYSGKTSYYKDFRVISNDIKIDCDSTFHEDSFKLICKLHYENKKFDLVDLDPFGSAYDCFDIAVKMAKKGLIITLGELGHKRWKRLDFVSCRYDITKMEDFTIENLIKYIQKIGLRNKKETSIMY